MKTANELIRNLEMRVARLEKQSRYSNTITHNAAHTESNKVNHLLKLTKTQTYTVTLTDIQPNTK